MVKSKSKSKKASLKAMQKASKMPSQNKDNRDKMYNASVAGLLSGVNDPDMETRMLAFLPEVGSFSSPEAAFQAFLDENPAFSDDLDDTEQDHDYNFEEILAQINAYSNERLNKWQHLLELTGKFAALRPWQARYGD